MAIFTWTFLLETVVGGIIGNRVDAGVVQACSAGWQRAIRGLNAPDLQATRDELAIAISRSFLWAQQSLVQECLAEVAKDVDGGFSQPVALSGYEAAVDWLNQKAQQLRNDLKQLEKEQLNALAASDTASLGNLLQSQDVSTAFSQQLTTVAVQEQAPDIYVSRAIATDTGLMARLAAYFEFELQTNQTVQNWFQTQLLLQINRQLQNVDQAPLALEDLKNSLKALTSQIPVIVGQVNNLVLAVSEVGNNVTEVRALVTSSAAELALLVLHNGDELAELKKQIGDLLIALKQQLTAEVKVPEAPASPKEGPNLFIYGPAVPPERFFGRRRAKADIKNRIGAVEPQSINIVGLRRNGKSSMLRYVKERIGEFCTPEQKPLVVLLDLQDRRFHTPEGIVEGLRRGIKKHMGSEPWPRDANNDPFELEDGLEAICDKGYRLIVMFDEFGAIGKQLEIFQGWGDDWRSKASASLVTLVIASRRPLSEVYSTLGLTSPFGNIFSTTVLGALETKSWQQLLSQGRFSRIEISWVDEMAGKLPYYTQLAAAMVWQHRELKLVKKEFRQEAKSRFRELWTELTSPEKLALQQIAKNDISSSEAAVVEDLKLNGLVCSEQQIYSREFQIFVKTQR
ncbi:hypothetical protein IQ260_28910 [Leptolyngbya cf. ectocarpi LEGE 11479]|uniref:Uncharacterized protein n=1 Tax=Leptolyngbya cf. ectocarpi LEGE 11479 TaxID=1828722 RepID=A0A929A096_LEPEC|nr:hypothetical protein [Leptolyngbya ectocarpi]MBE9070666.1 hypothetical protein [Leptolyngbya cf. ectocarpi LEGE 11479]